MPLMQYAKLLTAAVLASAVIPSATAQASPNEDPCFETTWGYLRAIRYEYGAINTCSYPVAIWFKPRDGRMVQQTVEPGKTFRTGLTIDAFESDRRKTGWVAAICRAGDVPDREISASNWDAILGGKYECKKP